MEQEPRSEWRNAHIVRSHQLEATLREFVEEAADLLAAEIEAGAEVPYELVSQGSRRGQASLYCYKPRTEEFLRERSALIAGLPSHRRAELALDGLEGVQRYLLGRGDSRIRAQGRARAALLALLEDLFCEQTDFEPSPERLEGALARLCSADLASAEEITLLATLHGLSICSPELRLTGNLMIATPDVLEDAPPQALSPSWLTSPAGPGHGSRRDGRTEAHLLALFSTAEVEHHSEAIARARSTMRELLRALRLFGDGRIALGPLAWVRSGEGAWLPLAPGWGGRPHGMLVVGVEQEDELRAFCNLIAHRSPAHNRLAWALRRFELGCERRGESEALSDHLLALRALLDPSGDGDGLLASRLAALCAAGEDRPGLAARALEAVDLERTLIEGEAIRDAHSLELVRELAGHLRALLRDVLCGHLDEDLRAIADELLAPDEQEPSYSEHEAAALV